MPRMNSDVLEDFYSIYDKIQKNYTKFIREIPNKPRITLLNFQHNAMSEKTYIKLFSSYATDMLLANWLSGNNRFSIKDFLSCSDKFEHIFKEFTTHLQFFGEKFIFSHSKNQSSKNRITPKIFHLLGERVARTNVLDSGAVFTPSGIVHILSLQTMFFYFKKNTNLDNTLLLSILLKPNSSILNKVNKRDKNLLYSLIKNIRILDPACGTGVFLLELVEILLQLQSIFDSSFDKRNRFEIFRHNIFGIDINPLIIFKLYFIIQLWFISYDEKPPNLDLIQSHFICSDSLLQEYPKKEKFDIIIGNPPYVRQENIRAQGIVNLNKWIMEDKDYKKSIAQKMKENGYHINKRSDLYIYFFYLGLKLLKRNGIIGFLTSNSWLNIGFGFDFQEFILINTEVCSVMDFDVRAFYSAEINTITTILCNQPYTAQKQSKCHFIKLNTPIKPKIIPKFLREFYIREQLPDTEIILEKNTPEFLLRVMEQKFIKSGTRWENEFILAPPLYFDLKQRLGSKLLYLGEIASITRGITTGLNKFFILEKIAEIDDIVTVRNGFGYQFQIEKEFLKPYIVSPKRMIEPILNHNKLNHLILCLPKEINKNSTPLAAKYIEYGKSLQIKQTKGQNKGKYISGIENVPTLRNKQPFYSIEVPKNKNGTQIFIQKIFSSKYKVYFSYGDGSIWSNNTFYNIILKEEFKQYFNLIVASLLSSITYLSIELNGRRSFGMGALDTATFDIENILVINPRQIPSKEVERIEKWLDSIISRRFLDVQEEFTMDDRRNLDRVFLKILDLEEKQVELYKSITDLINQRINKSQTFKNELG
ncbi:MAG: Eco57I restriction-modification methylase domain-containing protein [Candidatus Lokiarchaeota archaeon]|nr:Eco57I restriction-modification methylase domain-containing protein [Candidatus Lokiarchaeota archaeon]